MQCTAFHSVLIMGAAILDCDLVVIKVALTFLPDILTLGVDYLNSLVKP